MKKVSLYSLVCLLLFLIKGCFFATPHQNVSRQIISFNDSWLVQIDRSAEWSYTTIPHTPRVEPLIVNNQWQGSMVYKKSFEVVDDTKIYQLHFEGVMHEAEVHLNGVLLTSHVGGYLPFTVDLTDNLSFDQSNELIVKVNNMDNAQIPPGKSLETLDFNFYGGIYRNVSFNMLNPIHISDPMNADLVGGGGTLIHFDEVSESSATGTLKVHIKNEQKKASKVSVQASFVSPKGKTFHFSNPEIILEGNSDSTVVLKIDIQSPELWSVKQANLYNLSTNLYAEGQLIDDKKEKIGIRKIAMSPEGFYLNGEKLYIQGTNRHQEYPYVGYAISKNADRRDAIKIKQAGFDFVRLSHYPQDESFLDACDELGMLVMNAIPGWQYYSDDPEFLNNSYQDIRDMVRRDRNHPSVVFWEVSLNESPMTDDYMIRANDILKKELPFDDTYSAGWIDHEAFDLYIPARQHGHAPDYWTKYKTKERPLFIAEYGDWEYYAHNAGFNQAAYEGLKEDERTSRQLRAHGEKRLLQQALNFQEATNSNRKGLNTIGDANWLMFDYNRGYADDLEASGISDIFRIPKFAYYFYQSQRLPYDTLNFKEAIGPMVKIATYWNEQSSPKVKVFSNCDEVALFLNGVLIERKTAIKDSYSDQLNYPPFTFDLGKFRAGELVAVGYINNKMVTEDRIATAQKAFAIQVVTDISGTAISELENDLLFVYAKIVDEDGNTVHSSNAEVTFTADNGALIGENPVKAEAGIATILIKVKPNEGVPIIYAQSESLIAAEKPL